MVLFSRRKSVVYMDGEAVRVVSVRLFKDRISVESAVTLPDEKLEEFLRSDKSRTYTLVVNFKQYFHDSVLVPPVPQKYLEGVLDTEVSRAFSKGEGSYVYTLGDEKNIDGRRVREVFVFVVDSGNLDRLIGRFSACGKKVVAVYPDVYVAKSLVTDAGPFLCLFRAGSEKKIFLLKDGCPLFIRSIGRGEGGVDEVDSQNIEMSVNYCRQSLRVNPTALFLIGEPCSAGCVAFPALPIVSVMKPHALDVSSEVFMKYAIPLSALFAQKEFNILPGGVSFVLWTEDLLRYGTAAFSALCLAGLVLMVFSISGIRERSKRLDIVRRGLAARRGVYEAYVARESVFERYRPFVHLLSDINQGVAYTSFFQGLSGVRRAGVVIEGVNVSVESEGDGGGSGLEVEISGSVHSKTLKSAQTVYSGLLEYVRRIDGFKVEDEVLRVNNGSFLIRGVFR